MARILELAGILRIFVVVLFSGVPVALMMTAKTTMVMPMLDVAELNQHCSTSLAFHGYGDSLQLLAPRTPAQIFRAGTSLAIWPGVRQLLR